jgi:hypothetical protein
VREVGEGEEKRGQEEVWRKGRDMWGEMTREIRGEIETELKLFLTI